MDIQRNKFQDYYDENLISFNDTAANEQIVEYTDMINVAETVSALVVDPPAVAYAPQLHEMHMHSMHRPIVETSIVEVKSENPSFTSTPRKHPPDSPAKVPMSQILTHKAHSRSTAKLTNMFAEDISWEQPNKGPQMGNPSSTARTHTFHFTDSRAASHNDLFAPNRHRVVNTNANGGRLGRGRVPAQGATGRGGPGHGGPGRSQGNPQGPQPPNIGRGGPGAPNLVGAPGGLGGETLGGSRGGGNPNPGPGQPAVGGRGRGTPVDPGILAILNRLVQAQENNLIIKRIQKG